MKQEIVGFWDGSGISWTICKQPATLSRQITTPTPHFYRPDFLLTPNQRRQSAEGAR